MLFFAAIEVCHQGLTRSDLKACRSCISLKRFVQLTHSHVQPDQLRYAMLELIRATYLDLLSDILCCAEHLSFAHQDEDHLLFVEAASCVLAAHLHVQLQVGYVT